MDCFWADDGEHVWGDLDLELCPTCEAKHAHCVLCAESPCLE